MKKIQRMVVCLFIFSLSLGWAVPAHAEAGAGYSIFIQKYKLEDFAKLADVLPLDGTKAELVKDVDGRILDPLPGMSYDITRVTPIQGTTGFEAIQGDGAFHTTVITDAQGLAHVDGLVQGMYQIVEKEHAQLKEVMEPVVVELPFPKQTGEPLNEVYIYPKSSVVGVPKLPVQKDEITRLPQTSGNIGTVHVLFWILVMIIVMGSFGLLSIHRKKDIF